MYSTRLARKIICSIDPDFRNSDANVGRLRAYFEILPNNDVEPINHADFFCETEQVFVTAEFAEMVQKFGNVLFEADCMESSYELKNGDCRYVTRLQSCSLLKGLVCAELFERPLPDVNDTHITTTTKPITKTILLYENDFIYGPFEYTIENKSSDDDYYSLQLNTIKTPFNNIPLYHIGKISAHNCVQNTYKKTGFPTFIGNVKRNFEGADLIDFISDDEILSIYGAKISKNAEIRSFNNGTIAQIRKAFAYHVDKRRFPDRFDRLFKSLKDANSWEGVRKDLVESFLHTEYGKKILEKYISAHKEAFFENEKQEYEKQLRESHKQENDDINQLKIKKEELEDEIRKNQREREDMELTAESVASIENLSKKEQEKINREIAEKHSEFDDLLTKIHESEQKYAKYTSADELNNLLEGLERDRERYKERTKVAQGQMEEVETKLRSSNEQLTSRLLELKPQVDALSGIAIKPSAKIIDYHVEIAAIDAPIDADKLIKNVQKSLNEMGRNADYNFVANILTTIAQSQFTIFSGHPGTGKTSLAKILGNSLGLKNRLLNIPVARGWTSSKDVLGFHNALSDSFNSSATGLYELLQQLDKEHREGINAAPAICLLDEFNLSQPEHYFSPFMEIADPESQRLISTGDHKFPYFYIPDYLRFLGTINIDESVQPLTPRMMDRCSIINFDDFIDDFDQFYSQSFCAQPITENLDIKPISGRQFIEIFTPRSMELPLDIERTLKAIINILRVEDHDFGTPINISIRKIKAIRAYHNVTSPLYIDGRYIALDYAVSQHIIPLLTGYGQNFGKRLNKLIEIIPDEMEKTHNQLKRIIEAGNHNMFTYGLNI